MESRRAAPPSGDSISRRAEDDRLAIGFNDADDPHIDWLSGPRVASRPEKNPPAIYIHTSRKIASRVTRKRIGSRVQFTSNKRDPPRIGERRDRSLLGSEYARPRPRWACLGSPFLRRLFIRATTHSPSSAPSQIHPQRSRSSRENAKSLRGLFGPSNIGIANWIWWRCYNIILIWI